MSSSIQRVGDSGIYTAEGMTAGGRAARLASMREKEKQEFEAKKKEIEKEKGLSGSMADISSKFSRKSNAAEVTFKTSTIGLKSASEYRKALSAVDDSLDLALKAKHAKEQSSMLAAKMENKKRKQEVLKEKSKMLSFDVDEELGIDEEVEDIKPSKKLKNPTVETSFLPDKEREEEREREKARLEEEWRKEQERVKNEVLEVVYSFWDGSGHRRTIKVTKGTTIGKFLELVRQDLLNEFPELRGTHAENMLYVKEDLLIPHHLTFYYLILTKARGKSGPLFHFDVHDDIRLRSDATVEKDESHPGKICLRAWYERNKHIFPASRWETFDPTVKRERYTTHGEEIN
jgi:protein FAM50